MSTMSASRRAPGTVTRGARSVIAGLVLAMAIATPAAAHAELANADPADGATVTGTPTQIILTFTEPLSDRSLFNLRAADGTLVGTGVPDPTGGTVLVLAPPPLAAGAYTIEWQAAAADGHIEKGRTTFTVLEPSPTPASTDPPAPTAAPTDATAGPSVTPGPAASATPAATPADAPPPSSAGDVVVPIAAGLLLVGGLAFLLLRRGRTA